MAEYRNMRDKNKLSVDEKFLFHGTSGTSPELIYTRDEGFDMRFSSGGMWG